MKTQQEKIKDTVERQGTKIQEHEEQIGKDFGSISKIEYNLKKLSDSLSTAVSNMENKIKKLSNGLSTAVSIALLLFLVFASFLF